MSDKCLWSVPADLWTGQTVTILGGGPSLNNYDVGAIKGPIIALNNAHELRPDADMLFFADRLWLEWNEGALSQYRGGHIVTRSVLKGTQRDVWGDKVKRLRHNLETPLSHDPTRVSGYCGGANAINIAYLAGSRDIVLLGFDMRPGHWHAKHKRPTPDDHYPVRFIKHLNKMAPELERAGVRVRNATPGSALTCFPVVDPAALGIPKIKEREVA